ncbi:hypothetical protein ACHAXS_006448, partial [Conticribra weissflogii]
MRKSPKPIKPNDHSSSRFTASPSHFPMVAAGPAGAPSEPLHLIYGSESPLDGKQVLRQLSFAKKYKLPVHNLSFLGSRFEGEYDESNDDDCGRIPEAKFKTKTNDESKSFYRSLAKTLKRISSIQELAFCNMPQIGNYELSLLSPFFHHNDTLRSLDLSGLSLSGDGVSSIHELLKNNRNLEVLSLGGNVRLGDEGLKSVSLSISSSKGGNDTRMKRITGLIQKRKKKRRLRVLSLENCGIGRTGASSLVDVMTRCPSLRVLELSHNNIGDRSIKHLAQSIQSSQCRLEFLGLNNVQVGDHGAIHLAEALSSNTSQPSLHTLSLQSNNDITDKGASSLLDAIYNSSSVNAIIESNHTLRAINLQGCTSVSTPILALAENLSSQCTKLKSTKEVIRFKMSKYLKDNICIGSTAFDVSFDVELMPYVLSFVGESGCFHHMYQITKSWNMPLLYVNGSRPQESISTEKEHTPAEEQRRSRCEDESSSEFHQFMEDNSTPSPSKLFHGVRRRNVVGLGIHRTSPILRHYKNGRNRNTDTNSIQLSDMLSF